MRKLTQYLRTTILAALLLGSSAALDTENELLTDPAVMQRCYQAPSRKMKMVEHEAVKCTIDEEDDNANSDRIALCAQITDCKRQYTEQEKLSHLIIPGTKDYFDNSKCEPWETCARFERSDGVNSSTYVCINTKHCGEEGRFPAFTGQISKFTCGNQKTQLKYPEGYESMAQCMKRQDYNERALIAHNNYRKRHQAGELVISEGARAVAQKMAEAISRVPNYGSARPPRLVGVPESTRIIPISEKGGCGYSWIMNQDSKALLGTGWATDQWYSAVKYYNFNQPGLNKVARTFTRMVWQSTTEVGFGISGKYVVARYCKKGMVDPDAKYEDNVFPKDNCSETQIRLIGGGCQDCPKGEKRDYARNACYKFTSCSAEQLLINGICIDCPAHTRPSKDGKNCAMIPNDSAKVYSNFLGGTKWPITVQTAIIVGISLLLVCCLISCSIICYFKRKETQQASYPRKNIDEIKEEEEKKAQEKKKKKNYFNSDDELDDSRDIKERVTIKKVIQMAEQKLAGAKSSGKESNRALIKEDDKNQLDLEGQRENRRRSEKNPKDKRDRSPTLLRLEDLKFDIIKENDAEFNSKDTEGAESNGHVNFNSVSPRNNSIPKI